MHFDNAFPLSLPSFKQYFVQFNLAPNWNVLKEGGKQNRKVLETKKGIFLLPLKKQSHGRRRMILTQWTTTEKEDGEELMPHLMGRILIAKVRKARVSRRGGGSWWRKRAPAHFFGINHFVDLKASSEGADGKSEAAVGVMHHEAAEGKLSCGVSLTHSSPMERGRFSTQLICLKAF